jgi:hypothetical protein
MKSHWNPGENGKNTNNEPTGSQRYADLLVRNVNSWWMKTFVFIKKKRIKTWRGVFILAFFAGISVATISIVSFNIQTSSRAADGAILSLFTDNTTVTIEDGSNLVNMDVLLNTNTNDVVAVKAIINYDTEYFELQSWDTSNSIFASDNTCIYEGKPCQIVNEDSGNGIITITVAKPTPGIDTDSGIIAQLVFKALKVTSSSENITLNFTSEGNYNDSDAISNDGEGSDILSSVGNASINIYSAICTSFEYSDWSECQPDSTQSKTVRDSLPSGCYGGDPVLEQNCEYSGPEACNPDLTTYSDWSECQPNGTQSRTVVAKSPENCEEDDLVLSQECTYTPSACETINYSEWSECQPNDTQSRTVESVSPEGCATGEIVLEQSCEYTSTTGKNCTEFTYSDWGACQNNGKQSRTVSSSLPEGCNGGNPELSQSCQYSSSSEDKKKDKDKDDKKKEKKKDKTKPKFASMPAFLNKRRGDMIWWKATDNKKIDYYTYNFNGKKVKTNKGHFLISSSTPKGIYMLRIKAYDKAGNSKSKTVTIRVR